MTERKILFSAPMVRAILDGRKTKTRRVVKCATKTIAGLATVEQWVGALADNFAPHPTDEMIKEKADELRGRLFPFVDESGRMFGLYCPYGLPGDRLWVGETFYAWGRWETRFNANKYRDEWHFVDMTLEGGREYRYAADEEVSKGKFKRGNINPQWWKRPAIFMPRSASRIILERTTTEVERLNDISEADAIAEGATPSIVGQELDHLKYRGGYQSLWEKINGPGSWSANPWVWVVEFKRVTP